MEQIGPIIERRIATAILSTERESEERAVAASRLQNALRGQVSVGQIARKIEDQLDDVTLGEDHAMRAPVAPGAVGVGLLPPPQLAKYPVT